MRNATASSRPLRRTAGAVRRRPEIEIRSVFEADDFGAEYTPELRERDERLRQQIERQQKA